MERNLFVRLVYTSKGKLNEARRKRIFLSHNLTPAEFTDTNTLEKVADAWRLFVGMNLQNPNSRNIRQGQVLGKIYLALMKTDKTLPVAERLAEVAALWKEIRDQAGSRLGFTITRTTRGGKKREVGLDDYWQTSNRFEWDIKTFTETGRIDRKSDIEFLSLVDEFPHAERQEKEQ